MTLSSVEEALQQFADGGFVIVMDDEDRENEGDLMVAADAATPEQVNFMMTQARGLICVAMEGERLDQLGLPQMMADNSSRYQTAFAVSVDAADRSISTGISAQDRAFTIRALADPEFSASDFVRPGHVFPLRARPGGVLVRAGHTEAAVDLARLAGRTPAGVVCEIASADGTMARRAELEDFAQRHGIPIITISDLIAERRRTERLLDRGPETVIPTRGGQWRAVGFADRITEAVHLALYLGELPLPEPVLVRVHSECLTGDVFGSQRCDCQAQLHAAMRQIEGEGSGLIVYLRQEGRGIGLMDKLRAYALQDQGLDTVEANLRLGLPADSRDYQIGSQIIAELGVHRLRVMSNNPHKYYGLRGHGLEIVQRVPIVVAPNRHNARYLQTKRVKMGHLLSGVAEEEK
ncbi:MAG: bifunctional 3,4-dihydroxy-2-butanone-4-phosphate synthase/GTP cyclohydrolase II [Candidatus Dormibacteraeota bacterium]|jgi:3,4-dihydroxy 2-butanone 4-phosphate synthase/GTP cyclohydrolase II|nr:bifunctional 3,4-dihydroxy-2-butanone-4-phosphate synthase/GTP cyclohydrolase II [Candidatus Dormibacteraeota bacterium]